MNFLSIISLFCTPHCIENPIYEFPGMNMQGLVPKSYIPVFVSYLCIPGLVCLFGCKKIGQTDPGNKKIAHKYLNVENWETKHYNYVLEIRSSFISGIRKSEPEIYIGFSPAPHLQCSMSF
jgi:hypothetical protein